MIYSQAFNSAAKRCFFCHEPLVQDSGRPNDAAAAFEALRQEFGTDHQGFVPAGSPAWVCFSAACRSVYRELPDGSLEIKKRPDGYLR
jgi:hypothetical protein